MRERYARDGIVFPLDALDAGEVAAYRGAAEEHLRAGADVRSPHLGHEWARALAAHPAAVGAAQELLAGDVAVWGTLLLAKPPRGDEYVAWHQDGAYGGTSGADTISAWIALSDSTRACGCMRVLAGTHDALRPHRRGSDPRNVLRDRKEIDAEVDHRAAVDVVLRAGQMSLHHSHLIHGSGPNTSAHARIGFVIRFLRAGVPCEWPLMAVRSR